jgi:hypothetical protein
MVHPCRSGNPGTTMHACGNARSAETLCGLQVDPKDIDVLVGYFYVCKVCFPEERGDGVGDHIENRPRETYIEGRDGS